MQGVLDIGILASGEGTNAENIILFAAKNPDSFRVPVVITNRPGAPVLGKVQALGVAAHVVEGGDEKKITTILNDHGVKVVCLAGYMKLLSGTVLKKFETILNIHPSWLPEFPGLRAYERAFASGLEYSGITVHFVDEGIDTGPILVQEKFPRCPEDTLESFRQRGQALERILYPRALNLLRKKVCED